MQEVKLKNVSKECCGEKTLKRKDYCKRKLPWNSHNKMEMQERHYDIVHKAFTKNDNTENGQTGIKSFNKYDNMKNMRNKNKPPKKRRQIVETKEKLQAVIAYNKSKAGIVVSDQMAAYKTTLQKVSSGTKN